MRLPTVKVKADTAKGSRIINESDFNGAVHVLFDAPAPDPIPATPEDIDKMKRGELVALLKAHGVEKPKGKACDLKTKIKSLMFVGL